MKTTLLPALLFLFVTAAFSQITFTPDLIDNSQTTANAANTVTTGDFDGDGDIDVVGGAFQSDYFSIYLNDGSGTFTQNTIDNGPTADGARFATTFDLDEDGDLDVLATSSTADAYLWYENDGSASFTAHVIDDSALANEAYAIGAADFDDDGDMDVVGGANSGDALAIFANDGSENFTLQNVLSVGDNRTDGVRVVKVADVDDDGDPDLVVAAFSGDTFSWYENNGSGVFTAHTIDDTVNANGATAVDVGDLDGDGDMDIVAGSNNADMIHWYENDGNETFSLNIIDNTTSFSSGPRGLMLVDLEQDGDLDVITAALTGDVFAWFENDGSGNFTGDLISNDPTYSNGAFAITTGDIDGDLVQDIVAAANISDAFSWFRTDGVVILGDQSFVLDGIQVYPNPVSGSVNVVIPGTLEVSHISLYDSMGKLLYERSGDLTGELAFDMSEYASGLYILKMRNSEETQSRKLIKE